MLRAHEYPVIGTWYLDIDHKEQFEIVAKDEEAGTIEIQSFSGEVEELDLETWYEMRVVSIAPPKDWSGPYEVDKDEFSEFEETIHPINWSKPFSEE